MRARKLKTPRPAPVSFRVRSAGREVRVTYQQLFATAFDLWKRTQYAEAARVFRCLAEVTDRGPRASIMLAHCQAMLGEYAACNATLEGALNDAKFGRVAAELHEAFVYWTAGLLLDVKHLLQKVVTEHAELPTPCLMLASLLGEGGNRTRPPQLLKQCIERDRRNGAIGLIARRQLNPVGKPPSAR